MKVMYEYVFARGNGKSQISAYQAAKYLGLSDEEYLEVLNGAKSLSEFCSIGTWADLYCEYLMKGEKHD